MLGWQARQPGAWLLRLSGSSGNVIRRALSSHASTRVSYQSASARTLAACVRVCLGLSVTVNFRLALALRGCECAICWQRASRRVRAFRSPATLAMIHWAALLEPKRVACACSLGDFAVCSSLPFPKSRAHLSLFWHLRLHGRSRFRTSFGCVCAPTQPTRCLGLRFLGLRARILQRDSYSARLCLVSGVLQLAACSLSYLLSTRIRS